MPRQEYCQSCGMPMSGSNVSFGTEKDGSPNDNYCSYCYRRGEFSYNGDMEGMIEICAPYYLASHPETTEEAARADAREFYPTLKRWRQADPLEKKTAELLAKRSAITLASVTSDGYPRPCVLAKLDVADGFKKIYFATGTSSRKTRQFRNNPKAGVAFGVGGDSVTAIGTVRILSDSEKGAFWQDWLSEHFPDGADDPEFCVLEFSAEEAVFFIGGAFETRSYRG